MNNWDCSPITQTNEVARKFTPKDDLSPLDGKPSSKELKHQLLAEDLQKIRRSNHSSHQQHRQDAMDDDEHDGIIKGLLYPGLEDSTYDCDFFDDDYHAALDAVRTNEQLMRASNYYSSSHSNDYNHHRHNYNNSTNNNNHDIDDDDNHAVHHRRSALDALASLNDTMDDSYETSFFASMGRPYADLSHQKLRR